MFTVFDGYCMVFMIYGDTLSFIAIFYVKILWVFVYKVTDIFNTEYMVSTRSPTEDKKWWFLKKSQIIWQR